MLEFLNKIKSSNDRKSFQSALKVLIFLILFALVIFAVKTTDKRDTKTDSGTFSIIKEDKALKAKWVGEAAGELKIHNDSIKNIQRQMQEILQENKALNERLKKQENERTSQKVEETKEENTLYKKFPKPSKEESEVLEKFVPKGVKSLEELTGKTTKEEDVRALSAQKILSKTAVIETKEYQGSLAFESVALKKSDTQTPERKSLDLLPTGSIIKAILINGMDAPTMSQAKDNPLITHMIVKDLAILPNTYQYDMRQCFILGEGYGDLSAERVYVRTNNLSCITEEGEHIDFEIKGYVAGEDGKIGMRGEVVSKQGAVIARAIVAGFVDGVGKAFSQVGNTVQVTPYGTTSTSADISSSELAKKGIYSGFSSGANRLADFYLKLADQVFPVIEIEAGREVDIVITNKKEMSTLENDRYKEEHAANKTNSTQVKNEKKEPK